MQVKVANPLTRPPTAAVRSALAPWLPRKTIFSGKIVHAWASWDAVFVVLRYVRTRYRSCVRSFACVVTVVCGKGMWCVVCVACAKVPVLVGLSQFWRVCAITMSRSARALPFPSFLYPAGPSLTGRSGPPHLFDPVSRVAGNYRVVDITLGPETTNLYYLAANLCRVYTRGTKIGYWNLVFSTCRLVVGSVRGTLALANWHWLKLAPNSWVPTPEAKIGRLKHIGAGLLQQHKSKRHSRHRQVGSVLRAAAFLLASVVS